MSRYQELLVSVAIAAGTTAATVGGFVEVTDSAYRLVRQQEPAPSQSWEAQLMQLRERDGDPPWWKEMEALQ